MLVWKELRIRAHRHLIRWGIDLRRIRPDRATLEKVIFPEILRTESYRRILFVGTAWYTLHYPSLFAGREFHTLEISPDEAQYGAEHHIIDSCERIDCHFAPSSLDVVLFNGVYGFGLNEMGAINRSLVAIHRSLRPRGLFVFGWNDLPPTAPYPIESIDGLKQFDEYAFPPIRSAIYESDPRNRHRFQFFQKPEP